MEMNNSNESLLPTAVLRSGPRNSAELAGEDVSPRIKSAQAIRDQADDTTSNDEPTTPVYKCTALVRNAPYRWKSGSRISLAGQDTTVDAVQENILAETSGKGEDEDSDQEAAPFRKCTYDPTIPTRTLSMRILPIHDGPGDFSCPLTADLGGAMRKSSSFAEYTGIEAKHAFEKIDEGIACPELQALYEQCHASDVNDGRDGWFLVPKTRTRCAPPVRTQLEGWDYVRDIRDEVFEELAMQYKPPLVTSAQVIGCAEGCNNRVAVIEYDDGTKVCIRVPCCGSPGVWNEAARKTMRNNVDTMRYLKATTKLKVPNVIAWDEGFGNKIRTPFVVMECLEGQSVDKIWWDDGATSDRLMISPRLEKKRQRILKSIAEQVVLLKDLKFHTLGAFALVGEDVTRPTILAVDMLPFADILSRWEQEDIQKRCTGFHLGEESNSDGSCARSDIMINNNHDLPRSSYEAWTRLLDSWFKKEQRLAAPRNPNGNSQEDLDVLRVHGLYSLFHVILRQLPFAPHEAESNHPPPSEKDTLVLAQTDFQPQNIFVDGDGNVTGFIDWDYTTTKPRYLGWSQQPLWLCDDWDVSRAGNVEDGLRSWPGRVPTPTPARELERYRTDYARYLLQACGGEGHDDDWRFTPKSCIFDAITLSLGQTEQMARVLHRLLVCYIGVYDWDAHLMSVGRDGLNPSLEAFYDRLFGEVFTCDPCVVRAELGLLNTGEELRCNTDSTQEWKKAQARVLCTQKELLELFKAQLMEKQKQLAVLQQSPNERYTPGLNYPSQTSRSPDVSFRSFNSASIYEMSGAIQPPSPVLSAHGSELLAEQTTPQFLTLELPIWQRIHAKIRSRMRRYILGQQVAEVEK